MKYAHRNMVMVGMLPLYPPYMTDLDEDKGIPIGGAARAEKDVLMSNTEKLQEFIYEKALHTKFPMASDATVNGMHNMEAARNDPNATVLEDLRSLGNKKDILILKNLGAKDYDKGVIYGERSDISKKFANSPELEGHIVSLRNEVLNDKPLADKDIIFESSKSDFLNNQEKLDRHAFIHYGKIIDQNVDQNGIYTCKIIDYSDFANKRNSNILDIPNKWGYDMQEKGLYKNYYIIIKIRKKVNW